MTEQNQEVLNRAERAFNSFTAANPDFVVSEASATLLADAVKRLRLPFDKLESLQHAWTTIKPRTTPARRTAPAPVAAPAPPAPEPMELAIEREALRILETSEIEDALQNLSAKQFEQKSYNRAFARALEIREERRVKQTLARGDIIAAEQRANQQGTSPVSEIAAAEKRMTAAQNPYPYSPRAARRDGIVSTHDMATYSTRRKKTPEAIIAADKRDQKWISEQEELGWRRRRIAAHKQK